MKHIQAKRKWATLSVLGVLAVGFSLSLGASPPAMVGPSAKTPKAPKARVLTPPAASAERPELTPAVEQSAEEESASLSKTSVCRGELNFVNVHGAHMDDLAPNQTAYVRIGGQSLPLQGTQVPFRLAAVHEGAIHVVIETDGLISRELEVAPPVVEDCEHRLGLEVAIQQDLGSPDRPTFGVKVLGAGEGDNLFDVQRLEWDFGDGQTTQTAEPTVQHNYEPRLQNTRYSHYLVRVVAHDSAGRSAEGALSVVLSNPAFRHLDRDGAVRLMIAIDEADPTDPKTQSFRLYHGHDADVSIESISMVETEYAGGDVPPARAEAVDLVPRKVLGFTSIGVGETRELGNLRELAANRPGVIRRLYLKGTAADGRPAFGRISLAPIEQALN